MKYKFELGGKKFEIESPTALSDQDIAYISSKTFGAAQPAQPAAKPDDRSILGGAVADTLGLSERPGAVPLTGTPGTKTPLGVVLKPEGVAEHLTSMAVQAPLVAAGGGLATAARVPAALGRIAASGALGGAEGAATGVGAGPGAALGTVSGALGEAGGKVLPKAVRAAAKKLGVGEAKVEQAPSTLLDARGQPIPAAPLPPETTFGQVAAWLAEHPEAVAALQVGADAPALQPVSGVPLGAVAAIKAPEYIAEKGRGLVRHVIP